MKKKLLALAIAGAFVAPVAMADSANVTVYGIADVSVDFTDTDDSTAGVSGNTTHKVSSNSSRIGFKGSEDLGGGLKAIFQVERGVTMDDGLIAENNARNTFAGLSGDSWGSLTFGRNDTAYKTSTRGLDVFLDHIADNRTLMGRGTSSFDTRFKDTVRYDSPNMSGFKVAATYTAGAENNTLSTHTEDGKALALSATYATGPFSVAGAYQKNDFGSTTTGAGGVAALAGALVDEDAWKIGASYKVDQFALNAVYEEIEDSLGNAAGGMGHDAYYVSGVFNATANDAIKLAYGKAEKTQDDSLANSGAKQWSIGVDHSLSKRTTVYAMYTQLDNESAASYSLSAATVATGVTAPVGAGADPSAFSFGLKHSF